MQTSFAASALSLKSSTFSGKKKSSGESVLFFPQVFFNIQPLEPVRSSESLFFLKAYLCDYSFYMVSVFL